MLLETQKFYEVDAGRVHSDGSLKVVQSEGHGANAQLNDRMK